MDRVLSFLDAGEYGKALEAIEPLLEKYPENADLSHAKIAALSSLGRHKDAAQFALACTRKFPEVARFRYEAGTEASAMGMYPQAVGQLSKVYGDPVWGEAARLKAADAMILNGEPEKAREVLRGALEGKESHSAAILNRLLDLETDVAEASGLLDRLIRSDPPNSDSYGALKRLLAGAGPGGILEEVYPGQGPYEIPLKEKSEFLDANSLSWEASGDSKTMRMGGSSRVVFSASIDGSKPKWVTVGSGLRTVMISPKALKELGLEAQSTKRQLGLAYFSEEPVDWVLLKSLRIGELEYRNLPAMVVGEKYAAFWEETVAAVPFSLFRGHAIHYDRRDGNLVLLPAGTPPEAVMGEGTYRVTARWDKGRPYVSTVLQGRPGCYFLLDTGAVGTYLSAETVGGLGLTVTTTGSLNDLDRTLSRGFLYPTANPLSTPVVAVGEQGSVAVRGTTQLAVTLPRAEADRKTPAQEGVAKEVSITVGRAAVQMPGVPVAVTGQDQQFESYGILGRNITDLFEIFFDPGHEVVAFRDYKKR